MAHLRLHPTPGVHRLCAPRYGLLPDLSKIDWGTDVCFVWNGTTSGVCLPQGGEWMDNETRGSGGGGEGRGLALCDATSAAFCMDLPWERLDVTTFSWQKALGGEGAHGMLVLSPQALSRLESAVAPRDRCIPKVRVRRRSCG